MSIGVKQTHGELGYLSLKSHTAADSSKSAFIQLNRQHNRKLNWNKELEQRALDYLNGKMMMITGERTYPKNDTVKLGTKVFKAFSSTIWRRREEVPGDDDLFATSTK
uniref:Uncharacterized protein n=1 Tax=Haemonchus contortus TaxID=6289 RepID=W6NRB0_HAECO